MKKTDALVITKRSGAREKFSYAKLRRCVAAAMDACGYDGRYADALAKAVLMHLSEMRGARPLTTQYVFECVQTVLHETDLKDVARVLAQHRRQRAIKRRRVVVVDGGEGGVPARWCKSVVAETYERQFGLSAEVSRVLGAAVEEHVLESDATRMSAALVAELMHAELMAWGLSDDALRVVETGSIGGAGDE